MYGTEVNPEVPVLGADSFLNKYLGKVEADSDFAGVAKSIYEEAFVNAGVVLTEEIRETSIVSAERTFIKILLPTDKKKAKKRLRYLHP